MKLVRGQTLSERLDNTSTLDDRLLLLGHFEDICHAIAYAHSKGIIHRDIKPGNVMIGEFGETVVLDWGLAKQKGIANDALNDDEDNWTQLQQTQNTMRTVHGRAIGTPSYMSPEMARGDVDQIDERSDVWCLGVVLYEILSGNVPFTGKTSAEVIEQIRKDPVRPVRDLCSDIPQDLAAVCQKAIERNPQDRYQDARQLAAEIQAFRSGSKIKAYDYTSWELFSRFVQKNKWLSLLFSVLIVALSVGSLFVYLAWRDAEIARYKEEASKNVAIQERARAMEHERDAHYSLSISLLEKAWRAYDSSRFGSATVLAAGALLHNPYNPYSPHHYAGRLGDGNFAEKQQLIDMHSLYFQASLRQRVFFRATLQGHKGPIIALAISPDKKTIVTGSQDKTIRLWNLKEGTPITTFFASDNIVYSVDFSPNSTNLAYVDGDGWVGTWDLKKDVATARWKAFDKMATEVLYLQDGSLLATGGKDQGIKIWNVADHALVATLKGHENGVIDMLCNSSKDRLISVDETGKIRVWNSVDYSLIKTITPHQKRIITMALSNNDRLLAVGGTDNLVEIWDLTTSKFIGQLAGHEDIVSTLSFSQRDDLLVSGGEDKTIILWDLKNMTQISRVDGHDAYILRLRFAGDGKTILASDFAGILKIWQISDNAEIKDYTGLKSRIWNLDISSSRPGLMVAGSNDGKVMIWNKDNSKEMIYKKRDMIARVVFSPDGRLVAGSTSQGSICLWEVDSGKLLHTFVPPQSGYAVFAVVFTPDGKTLVTGGYDKAITFWNVETGKRLSQQLLKQEQTVLNLAISPDGSRMASAGLGKTIWLWSLPKGELQGFFLGHEDWVSGLDFSPDGQTLATSSRDKTVRLWDIATGRNLFVLRGHTDWSYTVKFSPDGEYLLSAGDDQTARLWNAKTGRLLQTLRHSYEVTGIGFSPAGDYLFANDREKLVQYPIQLDSWKMAARSLLKQAEQRSGIRMVDSRLKPLQ